MSRDGVRDAFWPQPWDSAAFALDCAATWGPLLNTTVLPRTNWAAISFGGRKLGAASNIVFSNGEYDPWRATGVLSPPLSSPSLVAVHIPDGAHHLDLSACGQGGLKGFLTCFGVFPKKLLTFWFPPLPPVFSHPSDPPSVKAARAVERREVRRWVAEAHAAGGAGAGAAPPPPPPALPSRLLIAAALGATATAGVAAALLLLSRPGAGGGGGSGGSGGAGGGGVAAGDANSGAASPFDAEALRRPLMHDDDDDDDA